MSYTLVHTSKGRAVLKSSITVGHWLPPFNDTFAGRNATFVYDYRTSSWVMYNIMIQS